MWQANGVITIIVVPHEPFIFGVAVKLFGLGIVLMSMVFDTVGLRAEYGGYANEKDINDKRLRRIVDRHRAISRL